MKKIYLQPAIRARKIIPNRLLAGSPLEVSDSEADSNYTSIEDDGGNGDAKQVWGCTFGCSFGTNY